MRRPTPRRRRDNCRGEIDYQQGTLAYIRCLATYVFGCRCPCDEFVVNGACFGAELQRWVKSKFGSESLHGRLIRRRLFVVHRSHLDSSFHFSSCPPPGSGPVYRGRSLRASGRAAYARSRSSVRYFGAMAFAFTKNSAICFSSSSGGGVVRVATGTPTSRKNLSLPAGEQMQIIRTG